jgi:hypothetical protein
MYDIAPRDSEKNGATVCTEKQSNRDRTVLTAVLY